MARSAAVPAFCIAFIGYFAFHAVVGPSGLLAWSGYQRERSVLETRVAHLNGERIQLERRARLLDPRKVDPDLADELRSEEHTSELQSLMRISYAVFCLKKKK